MALPTVYNTGTATLTANSAAVTGQGTTWATSGIQAGDLIWAAGNPVRILSVNSETSITLAAVWPAATRTASAYEIWYTPDVVRMQATSRQLLDQLTNGNLTAEAGLSSAADKVSYYSGPGAKTLADFKAFGRTLAATTTVADAISALGFGNVSGQIALPFATATVPGITFTGDLDTGFSSPSPNQINVVAGGATRAIFGAAGFAVGKPAVSTGTDNSVGVSITTSGIVTIERDNIGLYLNRTASTGQIAQFRQANTFVGSISVTASATTYSTTSDGRIKTDRKKLADVVDVRELIRSIEVFDFAWTDWSGKKTGERGRGFIAQDLFKVVPEAVSHGEGVRGKENFAPWGVDQGKLAPYLVAGLQDVLDRLDDVERRLAA